MNMHLAICHPCSRQIATLVLTSKDFARIAVVEHSWVKNLPIEQLALVGKTPPRLLLRFQVAR